MDDVDVHPGGERQGGGAVAQVVQPNGRQSGVFPWIAVSVGPFDKDATGLHPLVAGLQLEEYRRERYESAVGEVERLDTDDDFEYRMRVMIYLHVARFMRNLLDRKDRMSMAVGLEVRVPFCDHRIVEYVYNTSWSMKTYDGMEKSLLHGAVKDMLPESVAWRPKSPYPSTQDPFYAKELQQQGKELLTNRDHDVFTLINQDWLVQATALEPTELGRLNRLGLERTLDLAVWLDIYRPELKLP